MQSLYIILTNNSNIAAIESCKIAWLDDVDYMLLSDIDIPEMNSIGFPYDDGVSHETNKKLYFLFKHRNDLIKNYDWITFLDDTCFVFKDKIEKELKIRDKSKLPRILGNDSITQIDYFNTNHCWGNNVKDTIFNMRTGISINKTFANATIDFFNSFDENQLSIFFKDTLLEDMFFYYLLKEFNAKSTRLKSRVFINAVDNFEENFYDYSVISGLNPIDKTIILRNCV